MYHSERSVLEDSAMVRVVGLNSPMTSWRAFQQSALVFGIWTLTISRRHTARNGTPLELIKLYLIFLFFILLLEGQSVIHSLQLVIRIWSQKYVLQVFVVQFFQVSLENDFLFPSHILK